jgi:hypothetical protein
MNAEEDLNLRTVGTAPVGRLHRGAVGTVVAPTNKWPVRPSIPSRVETVIHSHSGVAKAFGSSAFRFSDLPADGRALSTEYQARSSSLRSHRDAMCVSKNGSVAFASAKRAGFADDAPLRPLPGPGQYDVPVPRPRVASCESAFRGADGAARAVARSVRWPGPGEYALPSPTPPCCAMTSRAPRLPPMTGAGGPGPGECLPDAHVNGIAHAARRSRASGRASGPSFFNKSTTQRFQLGAASSSEGGTGRAADLPASPGATAGLLPAPLMRVPESQLSPHVARALAIPAPASLRSQPAAGDAEGGGGAAATRLSAVFRETNLDRFGRPIVRYAARADESKVGPGSYTQLVEHPKQLVSSSWALDASVRGALPASSAPGPAYYSPAKPPRQSVTSFHVREDLPKADLTAANFRFQAAQQRRRAVKSTWI